MIDVFDLGCLFSTFTTSDRDRFCPIIDMGGQNIHDQDGIGAVSYTHLDVYKRQRLWAPV